MFKKTCLAPTQPSAYRNVCVIFLSLVLQTGSRYIESLSEIHGVLFKCRNYMNKEKRTFSIFTLYFKKKLQILQTIERLHEMCLIYKPWCHLKIKILITSLYLTVLINIVFNRHTLHESFQLRQTVYINTTLVS